MRQTNTSPALALLCSFFRIDIENRLEFERRRNVLVFMCIVCMSMYVCRQLMSAHIHGLHVHVCVHVFARTCSQSWKGDRRELILLAELEHFKNHVFNVADVVLDGDVNDVSAGQQTSSGHDHPTRLVTRRSHCREEAAVLTKVQHHISLQIT